MWIARNKDGDLILYQYKPTKELDCWVSTGKKVGLVFADLWFPEVKWEDEEPRELILK